MPVIPAFRSCQQEDQQFKVILGYIVRSQPAWALGDPVSNNNNENIITTTSNKKKVRRKERRYQGKSMKKVSGYEKGE